MELTMKRPILVSLTTLFLAAPAFAQVQVADPWVRGTVAQQKATGAFMKLTAADGSRLVEVRTPAAGVAEIHEMAMVDNVMRMRAVPGIELPAGKSVELRPGGYHLMLMDLKQQLKPGDTVPITLVFEDKDRKRQTVEVSAPVRPLNEPAQKGGHAGGHADGHK
jgi:copper(I)-binding protein